MTQAPLIHTPRLRLRAPALQDVDALHALYADPRSTWIGGPKTHDEIWQMLQVTAGQWALRGYGLWHIADPQDNRYLGFTGIFHPRDWPEPELGWGVIADCEGKGLAREAVVAAREVAATTLGLGPLVSYIAPENPRSIALATRIGATRENTLELRGKTVHAFRHPEHAT